ncbi:hypothetical protein GCM10009718_15640 [Isoptericola halotolerans]|uniref:Uncharacterized protein n=1 Tax=Isoptericola halotolerans TaxID=300560 RepID=A0ABX1ZY24_9MICO|nr:hypothetical protein [Isoptericola halotolerans]
MTFEPAEDDAATLVPLEHSGWEAYPDPTAARADDADGWADVLGRYARATDGEG